MENGLIGPVITLSEVLQALFVFSIVGLALWKAFKPGLTQWGAGLRVSLAIGISGALLGALLVAGSMLDQFTSSKEDVNERYALINRWTGPYWWSFWSQPLALLLVSAVLFVALKRSSWWMAWAMALFLSMPYERFVIIITSLHRDYMPSSWTYLHEVWMWLFRPAVLLLGAFVMLWDQRRPYNENSKG
ncbi:MAG: hypothetical protein JNM91_10200 [Flavobacteriales bacterium]|nr:hypothetical protein [Flavobacteriales bacterium]